MWVRAVAVAVVAVACGVATAQAQAAQYSEVWNPPEAAHPVKRAKGRTAVPVDARKVAVKGVTAGKGHKAVPLKKVASVHAAPGAKTHLARQATSPVRVAAAQVHPVGLHMLELYGWLAPGAHRTSRSRRRAPVVGMCRWRQYIPRRCRASSRKSLQNQFRHNRRPQWRASRRDRHLRSRLPRWLIRRQDL